MYVPCVHHFANYFSHIYANLPSQTHLRIPVYFRVFRDEIDILSHELKETKIYKIYSFVAKLRNNFCKKHSLYYVCLGK